ncbi:hypothetical protein N0V86_007001 [Didymella sp. IMI 355093]|nr:hypothetical protein N0V86_007001 [Didymella sp. IMI 355093]
MTFGHFGLKSTVSASKDNKAQSSNNESCLSKGHTNMPSRLLAKIKQKFNQQCRKTAGAIHCRTETKTTNVHSTANFTTLPLNLSQEDLSIITEDAFDTVQRCVLVESGELACANLPKPSELIDEPTATKVASTVHCCSSASTKPDSTSTKYEVVEELSAASISSSKTDLTVYSTATSTKPGDQLVSEQILQGTSAESSRVDIPDCGEPGSASIVCVATMADNEKKALRHKVLEVLNKLRIPFWPRKAATPKNPAEPVKQKDCTDRCQWDVIEKIEPDMILQILRSALIKRHKGYQDKPMKIAKTAQGSYHQVYVVKTFNPHSHQMEGWVIKIPGHGTPDRWTADDEYMLKQEYETMRLITAYTNVPAPFPIDYSATLDNQCGFPYMVMKELPGKNACELWYDDLRVALSPETEQKRENMLHSLAGHMTELNKLRFDQIGMPMFDPTAEDFETYDDIETERLPVDKYYVWPFCDTYRSVERGPFGSTQAFVRNGIDESNEMEGYQIPKQSASNDGRPMMSEDGIKARSTSKFFDILTSHPVFQSTASDTFALRHSDLDLQNILIDDDGNVTGILDWDGSLAMPRCVAHAAVPHFLELDWYGNAALYTPFLPWRAGHYRSIYAAALLDTGNPDVKFTSKSHIYQAVFAALYDGGDKQEVMSCLLKEIPGLQIEDGEVEYLLSTDCKMTEEMLKRELWKILEPEMPPEYFQGEIENQHKEATVQTWMVGFECFDDTADVM